MGKEEGQARKGAVEAQVRGAELLLPRAVSSVSPLSTIMGIFTIEEGARSNTETLVLEEMMHLLSNTYEEMPMEACLLHIQ